MLNELLKSRHYRLKMFCLILLMYTMFNCNGLIWLLFLHIDFENKDHINLFNEEGYAGIGISCLFGLISVIILWIFAIRIILQYYYKEKDVQWMCITKWLAKIGGICWILSMSTWTLTVLFLDIDGWLIKLALALIPSWNKSLCIGILYTIFYEFNPAVSRTQRVVRWLAIVTIFLSVYVAVLTIACCISWLWWILSLFSLIGGRAEWFIWTTVYMIFLSIVLTPFYNFYFVLWDQLRPNFRLVDKYYTICIPCCCGCFCTDKWLKCCVPSCCWGRKDRKITTWLIVGMTFVWLVCTVFGNNNECLAESSFVEYAYGFRGAAIIVLLFSVFINIELTYTGEVKARFNNVANNNNNNNGSVQTGVGLVVAPVQQVTTTNDEEEQDEDGNNQNTQNENENDNDNDPEVQDPGTDEQDAIVR